MLVKIAHIGLGLLGIAAGLLGRIVPGRQIGPARRAAGLGIGRDHRHTRLHQIVPVLDAFRIALAHQEHDGRGVRRGILRQAFLPRSGKQLGAPGDGVDIGGQRQGHHIGLQPVDHRTRLRARTAMAVAQGDLVAALGVLGGKALAQGLIQLAGGVIADIQQGDVCRPRGDGGKTPPPPDPGKPEVSFCAP